MTTNEDREEIERIKGALRLAIRRGGVRVTLESFVAAAELVRDYQAEMYMVADQFNIGAIRPQSQREGARYSSTASNSSSENFSDGLQDRQEPANKPAIGGRSMVLRGWI